MSDIKPIHTPCKNCVFAKYDHNTQTDCLMGLLDLYRNHKTIDVLEVYDEEKEFYVVNNKKCFSYKEPKYFAAKNMSNATIEEKIAYVKKISNIKYIAIINCKDKDPDFLANAIKEINKADVLPSFYMVITVPENRKHIENFYQILNKTNQKWKIKSLADPEEDPLKSVHEVVGIGAENCSFVLSIVDDYTDASKVINKANDITYKQFGSFSVVKTLSKSVLLFNKSVYKAGLQNKYDIIEEDERHEIV